MFTWMDARGSEYPRNPPCGTRNSWRRKGGGGRRRRKDREDGEEEEEEKEEQAEEEEVLCGFPGFRHVSFSLSEVWISRSVQPIDQLETHSDIDRESRVGVQSVEVRPDIHLGDG